MNGKKLHSKGLKYYCDQTEKDFEHTSNGYFCHLCDKNITDFREKTKAEYERIAKETPGGCGIFYADQVGDEIEISINWKKPFVAASFIASLLFSKKVAAQTSEKPAIELADSSSSVKTDTVIYANKDTKDSVKKTSSSEMKPVKRIHRKRLYVSGKFPFIHYRFRRIIGGSDYW